MKIFSWQTILLLLIGFLIAITSSSLYMVNTGDYYRSIFPFIENITPFTKEIPLSFPLRSDVQSIFSYDYISSYSYLVYAYAMVIRLFTNHFNIAIYSSLLKIMYIITFTFLFLKINKTENRKITILAYTISLLPIISSSNLAFFGSFYQEQVLLICLPLFLVSTFKNGYASLAVAFLSITVIACSKSQFFYIPAIALLYYSIFNRDKILLKLVLMIISLVLAIACIIAATSTVTYNKYHSEYFGVYEYEKINSIPFPDGVDKECVGIDAWGNRFDIIKGVTQTDIGETCFNRHTDANFKNSLSEFIKHPSIVFLLPFDSGVKSQLTENYFHVYKALDLIINNKGIYYKITLIKDYLFKDYRFLLLLIAFITSFFIKKKELAGILFVTSSIGCSQFYMAFFGEGYRDMSKHLFGMNFSFDIILFTTITYFIGKIYYLFVSKQYLSKKGANQIKTTTGHIS